MDILHAA